MLDSLEFKLRQRNREGSSSADKESACNAGDPGLIPRSGGSPGEGIGYPGGSEVKASSWNAGDPGLILGLGRFPGEGNGNPLQYSCLENPMEGGVW